MARSLLRPGRKDGTDRRDRGSTGRNTSPRSSRPRTGPSWWNRTHVDCRSRFCGSMAASPDWRRGLSTEFWWTHRAPGWVRCGAGRRRAGGAVRAMCRRCQVAARTPASAISLTRPGGVIVYATCSPHVAETLRVVSDALRAIRAGFDTRPLFAPADGLGDGPHVQLWPHRHGTDAMFAAAFQKLAAE